MQEPLENYAYKEKVRRHNRQIHKFNIQKGGEKKANQAHYKAYGFRLFDKVRTPDGTVAFVHARRENGTAKGYFDVRKLDNTIVSKSMHYTKLKLLKARSGYLSEDREKTILLSKSGSS